MSFCSIYIHFILIGQNSGCCKYLWFHSLNYFIFPILTYTMHMHGPSMVNSYISFLCMSTIYIIRQKVWRKYEESSPLLRASRRMYYTLNENNWKTRKSWPTIFSLLTCVFQRISWWDIISDEACFCFTTVFLQLNLN